MCNLGESEEGIKAQRLFNERLEEQLNKLNPTYHQVLAIGLKREEPQTKDEVFERQHGYPYFLVNYQAENFIIEWDIDTHQLRIYVCGVPIEYISLQTATRIIYEYRTKSKED